MSNPFALKSWSPYLVGAGIGVLSWFAFASANHPLGITSAFEDTAALAGKAVVPGVEETHPLYAKRAAEGKPPKVGWEWMLVLGVFVGAGLSSRLSGDRTREAVPALWERRFGPGVGKRLAVAFLGGAVMMLGARLAGGCTSGHGVSGNLQLAVSSLVFTLTFGVVGVLAARAIYGAEEPGHV